MTYSDIHYTGRIGQVAQARLAEVYRVTVDKMLDRLRLGMLILGDETKVRSTVGRSDTSGRSRVRRSLSICIIRPEKEHSLKRPLETSLASSSRISTLRMIRSPATNRSAISI